MARTIYATFSTEREAERAAGALMDHGVSVKDVSFIVPERAGEAERAGAAGGAWKQVQGAPLAPADEPAPDLAVPPPPLGAPGQWAEGLPNRMGRVGQDPVDVPPREGYTYDAMGAQIPDRHSAVPFNPPVERSPAAGVPTVTPGPLINTSARPAVATDAPADVVDMDQGHIMDSNRREPSAAYDVSTTTAGDATKGAAGGAVVGLGLGVLLGLAAVAIPGVGLVAGTGALVAGLAAATGAAGGVAGGVFGYLTDLGVPAQAAHTLQQNLQRGGPILSVQVSGAVPEQEMLSLLRKYGALFVEAF